jgi:hypothetical protein
MSDDTPTSFDAFAHEHNLNGTRLEIARMAFKLGVLIGRQQKEAMAKPRTYHHITDRDTAPGEFR